MGSRRTAPRSQGLLTWALLLIGVGALLGIGAASAYLGRKDRLQPEDPDTPLFI
ncbi:MULTISPECIES: hypothetical protein [Deinococcus]|uniref:Uncharacterized protein n=1 Tax=Deinococcus enclensis TaxID=1049582 RepID=A0ABT9MEI9_9DEIO|nr:MULTISPECIES: hypothetical protein [Deinococcus]MDP9764919.1 hypothetical protein [Deinococcus enclensis]